MKIGIIVGTRPEIIKMAPVIRECEKGISHFLSFILISIIQKKWTVFSLKNYIFRLLIII
jgi:hypothetical protein